MKMRDPECQHPGSRIFPNLVYSEETEILATILIRRLWTTHALHDHHDCRDSCALDVLLRGERDYPARRGDLLLSLVRSCMILDRPGCKDHGLM